MFNKLTINGLFSKTAEAFRNTDDDPLKDVSRVKIVEAPYAKADGCSNKVEISLWVAFLVADVVGKEAAGAIEDGSEHDLVDGDFKDESLCHRWDFRHFENFYFADPIEEEDLSEDKDQDHGLKLAVKNSVHDIGKNEGVGFLNGELWCLVEGVNLLHQFLLYLVAFLFFLTVEQTNEIVSDALNLDCDDRQHLDWVEQK